MTVNNKPFRVLSIDGGGVRGIVPVTVLRLAERELGVKVQDRFDLIVGTSTGAIVAGAVAAGYELDSLLDDYLQGVGPIFKKRFSLMATLRAKYGSGVLEGLLKRTLGDTTMDEIQKPLTLVATNATNGQYRLFRGGAGRKPDKTPVFKAILASCAAPIFFDPVEIDGELICDGGVWAHSPSLIGYIEAVTEFKANPVKILSLGTGKPTERFYGNASSWGLFTGWRQVSFSDFVSSTQTGFPDEALTALLGAKNYLRIDPKVKYAPIDDPTIVGDLQQLAEQEFKKNRTALQDFLE